MNYQHVIVEMKCIDRTNQGAVSVTTINARFCDYVRHSKSASKHNSVIASVTDEQIMRDYINHETRANRKCRKRARRQGQESLGELALPNGHASNTIRCESQ